MLIFPDGNKSLKSLSIDLIHNEMNQLIEIIMTFSDFSDLFPPRLLLCISIFIARTKIYNIDV